VTRVRHIGRVHADGDAAQSGFFERPGQVFEEMAVGGDGEIERLAGGGTPGGELADHLYEIAAQEGFAAGEADFFDAQGHEDANKAEVIGCFELGVLCPDLAGAAVDALIVAAVGDGNAEVGDEAAMTVAKRAGKLCRARDDRWDVGHLFRLSHIGGLAPLEGFRVLGAGLLEAYNYLLRFAGKSCSS
jgi:hypothetical protein